MQEQVIAWGRRDQVARGKQKRSEEQKRSSGESKLDRLLGERRKVQQLQYNALIPYGVDIRYDKTWALNALVQ